MINIGIVGSRSFDDYEILKEFLNEHLDEVKVKNIVSGGAIGADSLAEKYANEKGLNIMIYFPDWKRYGRIAGIIRNKNIVKNSDVIYAFWDGVSLGTNNTIKYAEKTGVKVKVVDIKARV